MCAGRQSGSKRSSAGRQVGEPELDERPDRVLEACFARDGERLLPALPGLLRVDALLQPVVTGDEELPDALARVFSLHKGKLTTQSVWPMGVRVLIADDHRLFAEALEAILAGDERIELVGLAGDGEEAVRLAEERRPDVILMDISMPLMDGIAAAKAIKAVDGDVSILMLTGSNARDDVDRARKAGAAGYVTKDRIAAELVDAILKVAPS
ncbi:MAG: response regulator transcription factor [Actinobacteria bacterium]|nr:MAG: response regulator transcription factor [Actinomycetota bacterium]